MIKVYLLLKFIIKILFSQKYKSKLIRQNKNFKRKQVKLCVFCHSNGKLEYYQFCKKFSEKYEIYSCLKCGHGFVSNPPRHNFLLNNYYSSNYYERIIENFEIKNKKKYQFIKKYPIKNAIEIGCMHGEFVEYLNKKNINCLGSDIIENPKFLNKNYIKGNFLEIDFNKKFDAILSFANLEHIENPAAYIRKASKLLNKNGILVIQSINFESVVSKRLYNEDIPVHLNMFNLDSLKIFLSKNNFIIDNIIFDLKDLYHDYNEGYFIYKILNFFKIKYTQTFREKCNFSIPYERLEKMIIKEYLFYNIFYSFLYLSDYFLYKLFKPKLNYQFLLIAKKI